MHRRDVLRLGAGAAFGALSYAGGKAVHDPQQAAAEWRAKALAAFPFPHIEVPGDQALATWEKMKVAGGGCPVVVGSDENLANLGGVFLEPSVEHPMRSVDEILSAAGKISFPAVLASRYSKDDMGVSLEAKDWLADRNSADVGDWPREVPPSTGLTVATDIVSGKWLPKAHIATIPTDDWTTIPAYLHWGGWNECPHPDLHVAALRSWRDRYGIELIGLSGDVLNLRATRRPASRAEAILLAKEQFLYCIDIVEQGTGSVAALAACLMSDEWWFFWWD